MKRVAARILVTAIATTLGGIAYAWQGESKEQDEALKLIPDAVSGMVIYDSCATCHQPEGWGIQDGTVPQLAGQHPSVLIKQLSDLRSSRRENPTTTPCTTALPQAIDSAQALADVAAYMEILPMDPKWGKGPWGPDTPEYAQGERIYQDACAECHGEAGMGDAAQFFPRINGQHHKYILRQLEWIRDGKRRNADLDMVEKTKDFTDEDLQKVVNFVSWQPVPKDQLAESGDPDAPRSGRSGS